MMDGLNKWWDKQQIKITFDVNVGHFLHIYCFTRLLLIIFIMLIKMGSSDWL